MPKCSGAKIKRWKIGRIFPFLPQKCFCGKKFTGYWGNYQICNGSHPYHEHWCYLTPIFDDTVKTVGFFRYVKGYEYLGFKITNCGIWHGEKGEPFGPSL